MTRNRWWWLAGTIGFLWFFFIIGSYFVTHKPFSPAVGMALITALWRILAAAGLATLGGALGRRLLRLESLPSLTRAALECVFGLGVLAIGVLLIGALIAMPAWLFWIALPVLLLVFNRSLRAWLRQWRSLEGLWQDTAGFGRAIAVALGIGALFTLTIALSPPVKYDALMYHLTLPGVYLDDGRVTYLPWIIMTGMPQTVEMLHVWMMALAGSEGAAVLGWLISHLTVLGLVGYLRQRLNARAAWVGAGVLMGGYTLATATAWAYADWWGLVFGFGMLVCLDCWQQDRSRAWLATAGLFAGMALACKYTAGVAYLSGLVFVLWSNRRKFSDLLASAAIFSAAALVVVLPWLVKNLLTTGNPVYPLFLQAGAMTPIRQEVFKGLPPWGDWRDLLLLPWRATYLGVDGYEGYSTSAGPLLLGLGALSWLNWRSLGETARQSVRVAAVIAISGLVVWVVGNQVSGFLIQTRYYYSLFPAFALLAATGFYQLDQYRLPPVRFSRLAAALVLLVLGLNLIETGSDALTHKAPETALGLTTPGDYLTDNLGWYHPAVQHVQGLPENSKVLLLYETRSFYCRPLCFPDEILDRWRRDRIQFGSASGIIAAWQREGFTHVLINRAGAEFLRSSGDIHSTTEDWSALDDLYNLIGVGEDFGGIYSLHPLHP